MKPAGILVAERPLAQHSERLGRLPPDLDALVAALTGIVGMFERELTEALANLLGAKPVVTCGKVEKVDAAKLHKIINPVAVNCRLSDASDSSLLASLSYCHALSLTDQVFGGTGELTDANPDRLPQSAELTLRRLVDELGAALGKALERPQALVQSGRSDVLGKLVSARDDSRFLLLRCEILVEKRKPCELLLILRQDQAARLLDPGGAPPSHDPGDRRRPDVAPFDSMPLCLTAVLAELRMPVSRITALKPGDLLPLALNGTARLRLGNTEIARGQIGTSEGLIALQLTGIHWNEKEIENDR